MNKICMGIWGNTNLPDRFNVKGFGEFVPVIDRIRQVGGLEDVDGIELHLPTEINDPNFGINLDIGHSLIAKENIEDQLSLICRYGKLYHTHFDDNDMQADVDIPPGTVNFQRLVSIMYVLDQVGYDGWFGLDLFPYRDDPAEFIKLSVDNLRFAQRVVSLMNERGASELRESGENGPAMARLLLQCIGDAR